MKTNLNHTIRGKPASWLQTWRVNFFTAGTRCFCGSGAVWTLGAGRFTAWICGDVLQPTTMLLAMASNLLTMASLPQKEKRSEVRLQQFRIICLSAALARLNQMVQPNQTRKAFGVKRYAEGKQWTQNSQRIFQHAGRKKRADSKTT